MPRIGDSEPDFTRSACRHLALYRDQVLGEAAGVFRYRGRDVLQPHVLPWHAREKNILEPYRERFFRSEAGSVAFHRYFHHLNSSQAMCLNLFYPLMVEGALSEFANYIGVAHEAELRGQFEKESDVELAVRRTSFDFFMTGGHQKVYVEAKYTERGFGTVKADDEHRQKYTDTYQPLVSRSRYLADEAKQPLFFLQHYQLMRNLAHIDEGAIVVLLFPQRNACVRKEALFAFDRCVNDEGRQRLKIVFLHDLVAHLRRHVPPLAGYYDAFCGKYLPSA